MIGSARPPDLERFRTAIAARMGLLFDESRLGFLGEVLRRRLDQLRQPSEAYLDEFEHRPSAPEIDALASELTVGETYFFRNVEQFRALAEIALPERLNANRPPKALHLLSAGCSSGEEAYSIAITAGEVVANRCDLVIRAVDINPAVLAKAAAGRYSAWALRDTPPELQRRWFQPEGRELKLDETVRRSVRFERGNLLDGQSDLWQPDYYDVIFCRNVLMYFAPERMRQVIECFERSLVPGGFLFLGHVETLRGVSDAFHLCHTHGTFYYRRKDGTAPAALPPSLDEIRPSWSQPLVGPDLDEALIAGIQAATDRVTVLVAAPPTQDQPVSVPRWDSAPVLDLLRQERFADALEHLRSRTEEAQRDPDTLLLEAALLAQSGQLHAAEIAARRLVGLDELNAGAHYVLALCREHDGDRAGAGDHDRIAAYLDPAFAMPRLHLGLLARRAGDVETARRELGQALILLKREEASRLLLFGGGFSRDALTALCRSALEDSGGRA